MSARPELLPGSQHTFLIVSSLSLKFGNSHDWFSLDIIQYTQRATAPIIESTRAEERSHDTFAVLLSNAKLRKWRFFGVLSENLPIDPSIDRDFHVCVSAKCQSVAQQWNR